MTLVRPNDKPICLQAFKYLMDVKNVLSTIFAGHRDLVNIDKGERKSLQDTVHELLKGLGCIVQPKWHSKELPEAEGCRHSCLVDIFRMDWDLMVSSRKMCF